LQLAAVEAGVGMAALPCVLGDAHPALTRPSDPVVAQEIWVLTHLDLRNASARTRGDGLYCRFVQAQRRSAAGPRDVA
jgi:hypothetical protein